MIFQTFQVSVFGTSGIISQLLKLYAIGNHQGQFISFAHAEEVFMTAVLQCVPEVGRERDTTGRDNSEYSWTRTRMSRHTTHMRYMHLASTIYRLHGAVQLKKWKETPCAENVKHDVLL